ncbi:hypothetical protein M2137_000603 [Parabacteroides sp. PFB2-10]|uniref:hypothetical protein n=1 Tax=Parabacteroides sp. PFB2-10 TaxID=1742405 RepID=UPI00247428F1|nr:hypothetical protein [Parabacteroides sp. PFB2-10]MDH6311844.1 hypothetical protein [Parabacteroides sp. PFB2-10]
MKLIVILFFAFLFIESYAQETNHQPSTLYSVNVESAPESCECNLDNLFKNWIQDNITNAGELELLSYDYVGIIEDAADIALYAERMTQLDSPMWGWGGHNSDIVRTKYFKITSYIDRYKAADVTEADKALFLEEINTERASSRLLLTKMIKRGDKVFSITARYKKEQDFVFFVFCNPQSFEMKDIYFGFVTL